MFCSLFTVYSYFSCSVFHEILFLPQSAEGPEYSLYTDDFVEIEITDKNMNPPVFTAVFYYTSVKENITINTNFFTVIATDSDGTVPNNVVSLF